MNSRSLGPGRVLRTSRVVAISFALTLGVVGCVAAPSGLSASGWEFATEGGEGGTQAYAIGAEDSMCQRLLDYKNRAAQISAPYCDATARSFGEFSEPSWRELDPRLHKDLISQLLRYGSEGAARYFDRTTVPERRPNAQKYYAEAAEEFMANGGRLQLWVTTPYEPSRAAGGASMKQGRNLVQLRSSAQTGCKDPMNYAGLFFVTDDLKALDPNVTDGFYSDQTIYVAGKARVLLREEPTDIVVLREEDQLFRRVCHLVLKRSINRTTNQGKK